MPSSEKEDRGGNLPWPSPIYSEIPNWDKHTEVLKSDVHTRERPGREVNLERLAISQQIGGTPRVARKGMLLVDYTRGDFHKKISGNG